MSTTASPATADPGISTCWRDALALWDVQTALSPPQGYPGGRGQSHWKGDEPLAYIDLTTRQVVVNFELLRRGPGPAIPIRGRERRRGLLSPPSS